MLVHLIRHGQTDWNAIRRVQGQSESVLTPLGMEQAVSLGKEIAPMNIRRVYCSSSVRARQTADHLFESGVVEIQYLNELREIYLNHWEGRLYDELEIEEPETMQHFWHQPHLFRVEGGESFADVQVRGLRTLRKICIDHEEDIAIVSHGALIKTILCHYEGKDLSRLWDPPHLQNCAHSILQLDQDAEGRIIRYAGVDVDALSD